MVEDINKEDELDELEDQEDEQSNSEPKENEIREKIADELGIDPDEQSDLLDRLVEREQGHHKKMSAVIKQKISWRQKAQSSIKPKPEAGKAQDNKEIPNLDELVDRKLTERLEAQELKSLNLSEELEAEVKNLAKLKGISIREAYQDGYITYRKDQIDREARITSATPKRTKTGSYAKTIDLSKPLNPQDFDLNTEDGIKAWKEARAERDRLKQAQASA